MSSIRIADTTREEREQIVAESIGNIFGLCDGCSPGIIEMYQDYIDGKRELREINADRRTRKIQFLPSIIPLAFGLPWWLSGKESTCNAGDEVLVPGLGRSRGEGNGTHSSIPVGTIT